MDKNYNVTAELKRKRKWARDREIYELYADGASAAAIALMYKINVRQVRRIVGEVAAIIRGVK